MNVFRPTPGRQDKRAILALILVLILISVLLSAPAIIYAWQKPTATNFLSLVFTLGFFCSLSLLIRNRAALIFIGIVVQLLNLVEIVSLVSFGGLIELGGLEAILYVDPMEAREFVSEHALVLISGLLIGPIFAGLVVLKTKLDKLPKRRRVLGAVVAAVLPGCLLTTQLATMGSSDDVYLPTRIFEHYVAYLGVNPLTNTISGVATMLAGRKEFREQRDLRSSVHFEATRNVPASRELYVVVIGESSRRRNWAIYGYKRPTNPYLIEQPGLIAFRDAVSPATITSRSVPQSFYFPTVQRDGTSQLTNSFVSGFRAAGFKTFWLSNQGTHRTAVGSQISLLMSEADVVKTTNYGFWNSVLDGALLKEIDRAIDDPADRKLIIVHTLGSHTNYRQRFPGNWSSRPLEPPTRSVHAFAGITDAEAEVIDEYDKTILYTDWFLHEIIERLQKRDEYASMVYFSDHGQRLYDDVSHTKGHGFGDFKASDVEIPLLVWLSDKYAKQTAHKRDAIVANACKPVTTRDLAASMIDLAGIDLKPNRPTPSFFSPAYDPAPRRVVMIDGRLKTYNAISEDPSTANCGSD